MNSFARLLHLDEVSAGYLFGRTTGALTPPLRRLGGDPAAWRNAPAVQSNGGLGGLGFVSALANAARRPGAIGITGAAARTIEFAFRVPDDDGSLWAFGTPAANSFEAFELVGGGDARWAHGNNDVVIPGAGGGQGWRHVVLRADAQGRCRATVDGAAVVDTVFPLGPLDTARGELRILESLAGGVMPTADLSFVAFWARELTDAEIAAHRAALFDPHMLGGTAVRSDGAPATQVRIRRASDLEHFAAVMPDGEGRWSARVPPGDYEIVIVGPSGFEPQVYNPVSAVPA